MALTKSSSGEDIDIKGPTGEISYLGNGHFQVNDDEFQFDKVRVGSKDNKTLADGERTVELGGRRHW